MPAKTSDLWWLFSRQTVSVTQNESVLNAALLMQKRNFRHLPVISETSKIVGVISAQDIIDSLNLVLQLRGSPKETKESLEIPVEKIMSLYPVVVEPGDGLTLVVKKMAFQNLGALPVVNELGVVQGIITLRDIVGIIGMSSIPMNVSVSEVMNTGIVTIRPDSNLSEAIKLMSERRVRRLPIIGREKETLGVITNKDILRKLAEVTTQKSSSPSFDEPVSSLMTRDVIRVSKDDDVRVAASRMMIFGVGGLLVEDLPHGDVALVTERDLVRRLCAIRSVEFLVRSMQYELEAEVS
ncbi:MAG: CBS domain-containing protein [Nitrososphaerales archaeon]